MTSYNTFHRPPMPPTASSITSFFLTARLLLTSSLFPYTTLFRSTGPGRRNELVGRVAPDPVHSINQKPVGFLPIDRKSTRLNSSHVAISYAVFCLKKKNKQPRTFPRRTFLRCTVQHCKPPSPPLPVS